MEQSRPSPGKTFAQKIVILCDTFIRSITWVNRKIGIASSLLIPLIMLILTIEVVSRYVFNSPTIWALETSQLIMCLFVALGAGITYSDDSHICVDILVAKLSKKRRALLNLFTAPIFFFFAGSLFWNLLLSAIESVKILEHTGTFFNPPMYPIEVLVTIGAFLLLLQGAAKFIKDLFISIGISSRSAAKIADKITMTEVGEIK